VARAGVGGGERNPFFSSTLDADSPISSSSSSLEVWKEATNAFDFGQGGRKRVKQMTGRGRRDGDESFSVPLPAGRTRRNDICEASRRPGERSGWQLGEEKFFLSR